MVIGFFIHAFSAWTTSEPVFIFNDKQNRLRRSAVNFISVTVSAGLVATTGMTILLWTITKSGWTNADMVRALGCFFVQSKSKAKWVGLIFHMAAGIPIAMLYTIAFYVLGITNMAQFIIAGAFMGFAHGFAFSFVMLSIAEHHPVEEFQNADFQVALAHLLGHIVYGLLVGLMVGLSGYHVPLS